MGGKLEKVGSHNDRRMLQDISTKNTCGTGFSREGVGMSNISITPNAAFPAEAGPTKRFIHRRMNSPLD
jgi:hypothetical protein